jgi:hypothetical protein
MLRQLRISGIVRISRGRQVYGVARAVEPAGPRFVSAFSFHVCCQGTRLRFSQVCPGDASRGAAFQLGSGAGHTTAAGSVQRTRNSGVAT